MTDIADILPADSDIVECLKVPGKINFGSQWTFEEHRSGWPFVLKALATAHNPQGVIFDGFVDQTFGWHHRKAEKNSIIPYKYPWIGMMHNPPNMPEFFDRMSSPQVILKSKLMRDSMSNCLGFYVFSEYMRVWLSELVPCPVESLIHPTETPDLLFDWDQFCENENKKIFQLGYWLRKMHSIKHLHAKGYTKVWLIVHEYALKKRQSEANAIDIYNQYGLEQVGKYEEWSRVSNSEYDYQLSKNIGFAHLYDSSANNAVIECVVRNTPLLVNRLPAVVEYLGKDYPFYFSTLDEAEIKLQDFELILKTHKYLKNMDKSSFETSSFLESFMNSSIYRNLPTP